MKIASLVSLMNIEPLPCKVGPDEGSAEACDSILPIFEVTVAEVASEAKSKTTRMPFAVLPCRTARTSTNI